MVRVNNESQTSKNKKNTKVNDNLANSKVNESKTSTLRNGNNTSNKKSRAKKATPNNKSAALYSTESQRLKQAEKPTVASSTLNNNQQANSSNISKGANNISTGLNKNTNRPNTSSPTKETITKLDHKEPSPQQQVSINQQSNSNFPINNNYKQNNNTYSRNLVNNNMTTEQELQEKKSVEDTNTDNRSSKTEDIKSPIPNYSSNKSQNDGLFTSMLNSIKSFLLGSPTDRKKDDTNIRQTTNGNLYKSDSLNSNYGVIDRNRSNTGSIATKNNQDIPNQVREVTQRAIQHISKESTETQYNNANNTQRNPTTKLPTR